MLLKSKYVKFPINKTQQNTLNRVLDKIHTGEYALEAIPCICGENPNDNIITNSFFPNFINSKINIVICKHCGTVRSTPYLTNEALAQFYANDYRDLYGYREMLPSGKFQASCYGSIF